MDRIQRNRRGTSDWALTAALAVGLLSSATSFAQEQVEDVEEVLPETVIRETRQQPVAAPAPEREESPPQLANRTEYFRGTIFDSPFFSAPSLGRGYGVPDNTTGAKIDISNIDYPGIVNVIPQDVLTDQQDLTTSQALRNVPGAYSNSAGGRSDNIILRGFNASASVRKNGLVDDSRVERDMANLDRIEVLKGPASFLYGAGATPAGIVNYITKKPLAERYSVANMQFGYFDLYRFTMDDTGPLNICGGEWLYRVNTSLEHTESFRDFVYEDRWFFAPVVTKVIDQDTSFTFEVELLHDNRIMDRGIPIFRGNSLAVPFENFLGQPTDRSRFANERFSGFFNHRFNDDWQMRAMYGSCWSNEYRKNTDTRALVPNTQLINRQPALQSTLDSSHDGIIDFTGDVELLGMNHRLLFGGELLCSISNSRSNQPTLTGAALAAARINVFNPVYTYQFPNLTLQNANHTWTQSAQYAGYFQDFIEVNPYLKFVLGARYTVYDSLAFSHASAGVNVPKIYRDTANYIWTPRYGVVLEPIPETLSVYCAYADSFNPVLGTDRFLNPLKPEKGNSYEYGAKFSPWENLQLGLGYYYIERTNITQTDPIAQSFSVQLGMAQSHGIEFTAAGPLTERLDLIAAYGIVDTAITKDTNRALIGNHLLGSPTYNASIWSRYNLIECEALTVGLAVGPYFTGEVYANNENTLVTPSWIRWDGGFFFQKGRLGINLYLENLGNVRYISAVQSTTLLAPGAPFNMRGMLSWTF